MTRQAQKTSAFAIAALLLGLSCYVQFLGTEKAVLAFVFAILAFRDISLNNKKGKSIACLAIVLAVIFIWTLFLFMKATTTVN